MSSASNQFGSTPRIHGTPGVRPRRLDEAFDPYFGNGTQGPQMGLFDPDNLFNIEDRLRSGMQGPSPADVARSNGMRVQGQNAYWAQNGINYQMPLSQVGGGRSGGLDLPPALVQALLQDQGAMQSEADAQWGRVNNRIGDMSSLIQTAGGRLGGVADQTTDPMQALADALYGAAQGNTGQVGQDVDGALAGMRGAMPTFRREMGAASRSTDAAVRDVDKAMGGLKNVDADVNKAYGLAEGAVATMQKAITEFEDRGAQDASTAAYALHKSVRSTRDQIESMRGAYPDEVIDNQLYALETETRAQTQAAITPILSSYNQAAASLKQALAGVQLNAAGTYLQGAGIKQQGTQLRLAGADMKLKAAGQKGALAEARLTGERSAAELEMGGVAQKQQAFKDQQAMGQVRLATYEAMANMKQAAVLNAVNLEMSGFGKVAELTMQNPRSITSWLQGLLSIYAARAASTGNTRLA
jgi:hypothetical protein